MSVRLVAPLLLALCASCVEPIESPPVDEGGCQRAEECAEEEGCVDLRCGPCRSDADCVAWLDCREARCLPPLTEVCIEAGSPCRSVEDPSTGVEIGCASLGICEELQAGDVCFEGDCCASDCSLHACAVADCGQLCLTNCASPDVVFVLSEEGTTPTDRPPGRNFGQFAVDPARGVGVLFGGVDVHGAMLEDTWLLDGLPVSDGGASTARWTRLPMTASPPARHGGALVWDAPRRRFLVLFGEQRCGPGTETCFAQDVWALGPFADGQPSPTAWEKLTAFGIQPPGLLYPAVAIDPATGEIHSFGGWNAVRSTQEQWRLWFTDEEPFVHVEQLHPDPLPRDRDRATFTAAGGELLLFGGRSREGDTATTLNDVWAWADGRWSERTVSGPPPAPRSGHVAAWVDGLGLVVIGGYAPPSPPSTDGYLPDRWLLAGPIGEWAELSVDDEGLGREGPIVASLPGGTLLFGYGRNRTRWLDDLWLWHP